MTTYRIHSTSTGLHLGDFEGQTAEQAVDAYAKDAGYADFADLLDRLPDSSRDDIDVTELSVEDTIVGHKAIAYAEEHGLLLRKYSDPIEGARDDLTPDQARAVAAEDPSLVYIPKEVTTEDAKISAKVTLILNQNRGALHDAETGKPIRPATADEASASARSASTVFERDGRRYYVKPSHE